MKHIGRSLQIVGAAVMVLALFNGETLQFALAADSQSAPASDTGDLSNLDYQATGVLTAAFVSPQNDDASPITASEVVVSTQRGAGIELRAGDAVIDAKHIGKRTVSIKTGETRYFFYGVPLRPGPNTLTATPLGANGLRGPSASVTLYGPADASTIRAEFGSHLVADGKTAAPLNVTVSDRFGHASLPAERVHVTILSGDAHFVDLPKDAEYASAAAASPSPDVIASPPSQARIAQLPLPVGAYFALRVVPGTVAGPVEIEIRAGNAYLRKSYYIEPFVRSAFVNGIVSGGVGSVPGAIDGDGVSDNGGARRERFALFGTGAVGKSLLTVAYESQNRLSPLSSLGPFVDDPNERPYLTYGDASQVVSPYHSSDHLYARVDRGRGSLLWGQYDAHVGPLDVGTYDQLLSGAKADIAIGPNARAELTGFTARNDAAFVSQILPISGLSALEAPLHPGIVVGSDYFQVVTLDRATGFVLRQSLLLRNVDYTLDYATGIVRFINIPLPFDPQFNPQVISLHYQYEGPGVQSLTTGGQFSYQLSSDGHTKLLFDYVNDATGTQNFALAGQSLTRSWNGGTFTVSHASSFGTLPNPASALQIGVSQVPSGGNAISFSLDERARNDTLALGYQSTSAGYSDPFGGFSSPGATAYRAAWTRGSQARGEFTLSYSGAENSGIGSASSESDLALQVIRSLGRYFTGTLGLTEHRQSIASADASTPMPSSSPTVPLSNTAQTQVSGALEYRLPKHFGVTVSEALTVAGSDVGSTSPSQTAVEIAYDLARRGRLFLRELWSAQPSATFANSTSNLNIGTGSTHSVQFGIEQPLSPATTVSSQYVVDQTGSGANIYNALGIDEKLHIGKAVSGNVTVQGANAVGSSASGFLLLGFALAYAPAANTFRSSVSYQDRTGQSGGSTLGAALAGHLSPNLSAVGSLQHASGNGVHAIDDRLSLAYRPLTNDRFISLFNYTRTNGASLDGDASNVVSAEELFRPRERLELAARVAYKLDGGGGYSAQTTLLSLRARQTIGDANDIGAEVRTVNVPGASGARATEVAVEVGKSLGRTARLAVGYNISGSVDPTLVGTPQRHGAYVTLTSLIDRIFGWGKP